MKLRTYKTQMRKALVWYTNKLYEQHLGIPLSPAQVERVNRDLVVLQEQMKNKETNVVWQVPVGLMLDYDRNQFEVIVADDSNVLYLDFDQP